MTKQKWILKWKVISLITTLAVSTTTLAGTTLYYHSKNEQIERAYEQLKSVYSNLTEAYDQLNQTYTNSYFFDYFRGWGMSLGNTRFLIAYPAGFEQYARAILNILDTALGGYTRIFLFSLFNIRIFIYIITGASTIRLYTHTYGIYLHVPSIDYLSPFPQEGWQIFHVAGFCHELGHIMFMTDSTEFNEGWVAYAAMFRIVPVVYSALGEEAWPHPYNYSKTEGPERFLDVINNATLCVPGSYIAAARVLYLIDQEYGPTFIGETIHRLKPSKTFGMAGYPEYSLEEFKAALADHANDTTILDMFSEYGF